MTFRSDNTICAVAPAIVLAGFCLLVSGCAYEHQLRAHDRKLEDLRLELARHEDSIGRAREGVDDLRNSWMSFSAREQVWSKESAALPATLRRLALRLDELDGKRARLEERVAAAELKCSDLSQSFTQVSSIVNAAEGDLLATRSRSTGPLAPGALVQGSRGAEQGGAEHGAGAWTVPPQGQPGHLPEGSGGSSVSQSQFLGVFVFLLGAVVSLGCVYLGTRLRVPAPALLPVRMESPSATGPEPPKERDAAAPMDIQKSLSTKAMEDLFDEAEKASVRFAGSASKKPTASCPIAEPASVEPADTVVVAVPSTVEPEVQGAHGTPAATEPIEDVPGRTQLIAGSDESSSSPALTAVVPPPFTVEKPRRPPAAVVRPKRPEDEQNLLDELENLLGEKIGSSRG